MESSGYLTTGVHAKAPATQVWPSSLKGRMTLIGIGLALYLLGFGMLAGATVERMRFDHKRSQILARYDEALREWHAFRIELEKTVARP